MRGKIDTIAFGGQGILRDNGYVVFIPFTAPGDEVQYEITLKKKTYAEGKALNILSPSNLRIEPSCSYFGSCGGCQFQHISYPAQLEIKRKFIEDALKRLAMADICVDPIVPSETIWGYRNYIRLGVRPCQNTLSAGYVGQHHNDFIKVKQCPIFIHDNDPLLSDLQKFLANIPTDPVHEEHLNLGSIRIFKRGGHYLLVFYFTDPVPKAFTVLIKQFLKCHSSWKGVILNSPSETIHIGDTECALHLFGLTLQFSPFGFIQNHQEQSETIYRYLLGQIPEGTKHALDLYCGIGITSLLMAQKGIETTGIESHAETVGLAKQNAIDNGIHNVSYLCGKAEKLIAPLFQKNSYEVALLNPPRTGLDPAMVEHLLCASVPRLIYMSCMPPTLARDLRQLLAGGYQIEAVKGFDMFPQTTHVETVITLTK